jgi:serine phosphatase RsbU (regulator of sigma subunit)
MSGLKPEIADSYNRIAKYQNGKRNFPLARNYASKALDIYLDSRDKKGMAESYLILAETYRQENKIDEALNYTYRAHEISKNLKSLLLTSETYFKLSELLELSNNSKEAYDYYNAYLRLNDSLTNSENSNIMVHHQMQYKHEKKLIELNQQEEKEKEIRNEHNSLIKIIIFSATVFTAIIVLLILIAFKRFRISKKLKNVIDEQKAELEKKNNLIVESIEYARVIQKNILKGEFELQDIFKDVFIINRPKDYVSGDFYWSKKINETTLLIALADCTGHGVPGAFMTFVGSQILDEIVEIEKINQPDLIINRLNERIHLLLQNDENQSVEGMEIAILKMNLQNKILSYSGAGIHLYITQNNIINEIKTEYPAIGFVHTKDQLAKAEHLQLTNDSIIYLGTDGFRDQKSSDGKNKIYKKRMLEWIQNSVHLKMDEQKKFLQAQFDQFRGNEEQTDDVLMIGIKV